MHFRSDEKLRNVKKWDRTESWTPTRFPCRCQLYCCSCCNLHGLSSSPCLFSTCTSFHFKWFPFILKVCVGLWSLASESFLLPLVPDTLLTSSAYIQVIMRKTFAKRFLGNENLPLERYLAKEFWINEGGGGASTGSSGKKYKSKTVFVGSWELAPDFVCEGWNWPY